MFPVLVTPGVPTNAHGLRTVLCAPLPYRCPVQFAPPCLDACRFYCRGLPPLLCTWLPLSHAGTGSRPIAHSICGHVPLHVDVCVISASRTCRGRDCTVFPAGPLLPMTWGTGLDRNPVGGEWFPIDVATSAEPLDAHRQRVKVIPGWTLAIPVVLCSCVCVSIFGCVCLCVCMCVCVGVLSCVSACLLACVCVGMSARMCERVSVCIDMRVCVSTFR